MGSNALNSVPGWGAEGDWAELGQGGVLGGSLEIALKYDLGMVVDLGVGCDLGPCRHSEGGLQVGPDVLWTSVSDPRDLI